jgi:NAD(P)H-nitrite reductase large subunit
MKIGIIGAGHAGVKAAETAAALGCEVVLYSNEHGLPYYRPRLIAAAFGQAEVQDLQMHPAEWYREKNIDLRLETHIGMVNSSELIVQPSQDASQQFDALVIASGAGPFLPPFMTEAPGGVFPLWNLQHAEGIRTRVEQGRHMVLIGGGILGIEAALRALDAGMTVDIVERMDRLMPAQLGVTASNWLSNYLQERGVGIYVHHSVEQLQAVDHDRVAVGLDAGQHRLIADLVVVSVGARRDLLLPENMGLRLKRGVHVAPTLETSVPGVFAAGDIVEMDGLNRCSALDATKQGQLAAQNAVRFLQEEERVEYQETDGAVNFRFGDFEVHSVGALVDDKTNEVILDLNRETGCRSLVLKEGRIAGVQMVGTGEGFKDYKARMGSVYEIEE